MKRFIIVKTVLAVVCLYVFSACMQKKNSDQKYAVPDNETGSGKEMEEDWRQAAEFEFKITKDASLGYVPQYRLMEAVEEMKMGRFAGNSNNRSTAALTWVERGPYSDSKGPNGGNSRPPGLSVSGRADAIWVDLADPTKHMVWVGTHNGGIWKTNDISVVTPIWTPVYDMMGYMGIGSICQDPTNTNIMYVGTGDKTNVGDVRGGGLWKSMDHGVTWSQLSGTSGFFNISKIVCDAAGRVYIASNLSGGIMRSADGGNTWINITPAGMSNRIPDMELSSTGRLHIYCGFSQGSSVGCGHRYTDIPATVSSAAGWQAPVTSFPASGRTAQLAVSGNTLLAMPANDADPGNAVTQFYKSIDGGVNWLATATSPDARTWSCLDAAINPANSNEIIFGSYNCFGTTDGGNTWQLRATGFATTPGNYLHDDFHVFVWNGNEIIVGCDGGVYFSTDNGVTFFSKNVGIRSFEFYDCALPPNDPDYIVGGTQDNGTQILRQPGLGSSIEVIGGDAGYPHIDQDQPQYQFGAFIYSTFFRSSDNGNNWSQFRPASDGGQFINPTDYDDVNNKMYCAYNANEYLRWEDPQTGGTFSPVSVPAYGGSKISSLVLSHNTPRRMFTALENGKVFRLDNIESNSPVATDISGTGRPASYISCINTGTDDNTLIASYSNYGTQHVWITSDGGTNWINVQGNLPDIPVRWGMFHPDDNDRAFIATNLGVWSTDNLNGAATVWVPETGLPSVRCSMLQYQANTRTLAVATYGRGIWTTTLPPLQPFIRFRVPASLITSEQPDQTTGCRRYKDYTIDLNIDMPPTGDAVVNLQVAGGATATQGADFDFTTNGNFAVPSSQLTFPSGSVASRSFTLRIYDDAAEELQEDFSITYTVSGATDALKAPVSNTYTVKLAASDPAPTLTTQTASIGASGFGGFTQPFNGKSDKSRTQMIYLASELRTSGFTAGNISAIGFTVTSKNSTKTRIGLTVSLKNTTTSFFATNTVFETGTIPCYTSNYNTVPGLNNFVLTTPFYWDGVSNLLVELCYDNPYGSSLPSELNDNLAAHSVPQVRTIWRSTSFAPDGPGCTMTPDNSNLGRPVLTITGAAGNAIETVLNSTNTEDVSAIVNPIHFHTNGVENGNIIASLTNLSAPLGCVTANVFEAGNTWQPFTSGLRSQKVIEVTPSQNSGSLYTIGVYYTAAELGGFTPASLRLAKTTAATMGAANAGNTIISPTTVTPYGSGYLFTATFTGFSKFFLVNQQVALPLTLLSFSGQFVQNKVQLQWRTTAEQNTFHFEIQRSLNGSDFTSIGTVTAAGNSTSEHNYNFTDVSPGEINYYRLKMVDNDGRFEYSQVIIIKRSGDDQALHVTNPFTSQLKLYFVKPLRGDIMLQLLAGDGRSVLQRKLTLSGQLSVVIDLPILANGEYFLALMTDNKRYLKKLVKQ